MSTAAKRVLPHKKTTGDQVFEYFLFFILRIASLVILRFFSVVIAFTLLAPIAIILFSLTATPLESAVPALFAIVMWPVALTGRTSYTQDDLDILVFGWTALAIIAGFVAHKLGLRVRIRFRHTLLVISGLYITALLILTLNPEQQDKVGIAFVVMVFYAACVIAAFLAWAASLGTKAASKYL